MPATSASSAVHSNKNARLLAKSMPASSGRGTLSWRVGPETASSGTSTFSNMTANASVASAR
ncbi:MAG: hypothetical protein R2699_18815 [Acidimicrobiales bacterium]